MACSYGIAYSTKRPITVIEEWLETNLEGNHELCIQGVDVNNGLKKMSIFFEMESDREKFKSNFAKK